MVCVPENTVSASAITSDPMFVDAANGNFRLAEGSPCIDAGDDPAIEGYDTDLDGNARIFGAAVDLGPYEVNDGSAIEIAVLHDAGNRSDFPVCIGTLYCQEDV